MKSKWFLALAAILELALLSSLPFPVAATTPTVKLVLGGIGITPWAIGNIASGNSGTQTVTLSNTGYKDGVVTIWISNIVNSEGVNPESETGDTSEPGELGDYLLLTLTGGGIQNNFPLPTRLGDYPQSPADTKHLFINSLPSGSTLNLQWEWRLLPETGNDIQGDGISFTINYALEEIPQLPSLLLLPQGRDPEVMMKKTGPSNIFTGFTGSYTLTVTNTGAFALNDVAVTDNLPELLSYQSSIPVGTVTGSQIVWNLGTLNTGETKEIVTVLAGVKSGTAVNTTTVTTREGVSATYSHNITVLGAPGAHISLIDSSDPVAVGDEFTYTIKVLNQSEGNDLHNMTVVGLIPGEIVFVNADGPSDFKVVGQEVRFGALATLTPGQTVEFHITVKATTAGVAVFNATIRWDEFEEPIVNQEGTTVFIANPLASSNRTEVGGSLAPFSPAPIPPQATPAVPVSPGIRKVMNVWTFAAILVLTGEIFLIYYIVILIMRRMKYRTTPHQR